MDAGDSTFTFRTNEESAAFVDLVAAELIGQFGIGRAEAIGRINRHWAGLTFLTREEIDTLTHELPSDWAMIIYFGADANWWVPGEGVEALPYP